MVYSLLASERTLLHVLKYVQIAHMRRQEITDESIRDVRFAFCVRTLLVHSYVNRRACAGCTA